MGITRRFLLPLAACAPLVAQQPPAPERFYVQATGQATVSVKPDQATIEIGVVTRGSSAAAAGAQNARQTDAVLAEIRKLIQAGDELKTTRYSLAPNYRSPKPGEPPAISGYTATNIVEVTLSDLTQVGKVIDAGLQAGANNIQRLQFGLKNPQAARARALREAAVEARANAEAIAAALGVRVVRVLSAEEFSSGPVYARAEGVTALTATPVEAGTVDVSATVTLKAEIGQ